jgi:hypothetical protein
VNNPAGTSCYNATTKTYGATCFDTLNVIATDPLTPAANVSDGAGGCTNTNTATTMYLTTASAAAATALAANFKTGNQILLVKGDGSQMTTTILTANGAVANTNMVKLVHNITNADGTNSITNDPLAISNTADSGVLGVQFCTTDFALKLAPITYSVDASSNTNPKLIRTQNGTSNTIAEQIIGFKVGASIWNGTTDTTYSFDANTYNHNWSSIRSVRVSLIGRTAATSSGNFQNTFDQGNYKVEAISVVINPRNLSMND